MNIHKILSLIPLYVEYSDGNGLLLGAHTSVHGLGRGDNSIRSRASRNVGLEFRLTAGLALQCILLVIESI